MPHQAFHRAVGEFADIEASPTGEVLSTAEWEKRQYEWLADDDDLAFIRSLMEAVREPGKFANWIAPPKASINGQPDKFEYVKIAT